MYNPSKVLRVLQYRILTNILSAVKLPDYIHGFETGKSISKMAECHVNKDVVISLDIADYFPSIRQYMVKKMFLQMGICEKASTVLSELTTYKSFVPQGSLTAPKISNIITATTFGQEIYEYCKTNNLDLTVYADDITISYNNRSDDFEERRRFATSVISTVTQAVEKYGFKINSKKTKVMPRKRRQWVCGAVVNEKVNMLKTERLKLRAIVHNCVKNGIESEAAKTSMNPLNFIRKYAGRINWFCQLNADGGMNLKLQFRKVTMPYLKKFPDVEIPELAWNSGIEVPYVESKEDVEIFTETKEVQTTENPFELVVN